MSPKKDIAYYLDNPDLLDLEKIRRILLLLLKFGLVDPDSSKDILDKSDYIFIANLCKSIREKNEP